MCKKVDSFAKELVVGDVIVHGSYNRLIKYVDVGPKTVYVKTLSGMALTFQIDEKLEVYKNV